MILPEYVTAEEVARVCAEIGMDDWSKRTESVVSTEEQREAESFESVNNRGTGFQMVTGNGGIMKM